MFHCHGPAESKSEGASGFFPINSMFVYLSITTVPMILCLVKVTSDMDLKRKKKKNQGTSSAVFTANYSKFRSFKGFLPLYSFVDSGGVHEWDIMVRGLVQAESHASSMAFELQTSSPHFVTLSPMMCFFRLKLSHTHTHTYTHKESSDDSFSTDSYEQVQKNI